MMRKYKAGGAKKKKAMSGSKMKKAKAGSSLKQPTAKQVGLKKLPTAVRNKMGYAKKGAKMGKCKYGCN